ncbi:MAG: hypothetical protein ACREP6_11740, partial [Candidatus Binataceae bacterium]
QRVFDEQRASKRNHRTNSDNIASSPHSTWSGLYYYNEGCTASPMNQESHCAICRRVITAWLLRLAVEDSSGFAQEAFICANCGVKLRLASEKMRDLQIDPWLHEAVARVLRGREDKEE